MCKQNGCNSQERNSSCSNHDYCNKDKNVERIGVKCPLNVYTESGQVPQILVNDHLTFFNEYK